MPAGLTTLSQDITYNGYTFPVSRRTEFSGRAKKDDARRTIIGMEYSLRVEFYVLTTSEVDASAEFDEIRDRLSKAGGKLTLSGLGLGNNISVNSADGQWDMAWGPFPEVLNWKTIGANTAFFCVWVCNFFVPECSSIISGFPKNLIAFNFRSNISIDINRLAKISTDGYLEIALTRAAQGNRNIPDRAGRYRNLIVVPLLSNFTRVSEDFKETMDRRRLDFVIIDQARAPNELPWGCAAATADHSAVSGMENVAGDIGDNGEPAFRSGKTSMKYFGNITASYVMLPGFGKEIAQVHFNDLLSNILNSTGERSISGTDYKDQNGALIKKFSVSEGLYQKNRQVNFAVEYMFMTSLNDLFLRGGFNKVEPNTNGDLYRIKWNERYNRNYDIYGINFQPNNDAIIDVCQKTSVPTIAPAGIPPNENELRPRKKSNVLNNAQKELNWIAYDCRLYVESDSGVMQATELKKIVSGQESTLTNAFSSPVNTDQVGGSLVNNSTPRNGTIIQERRPTKLRCWLYGGAIRAGSYINPPSLVSVGGSKATAGLEEIDQYIVDTWSGVPIFQCTWCKEYFIDNTSNMKGVDVPIVPMGERDGANLKV